MNQALVDEILDQYLYYEDIQQLAKDRGIPVSWNKTKLINALLASGRFDSADAVAFLNLRELRRLCREWRLPSEGSRDELANTVLRAIRSEPGPIAPEKESGSESRANGHGMFKSGISTLRVTEPQSPRTHPDSTGPWAVVTIISAVGLTAVFYWATGSFGFRCGTILSLAIVAILAVVLLTTSHKWVRLVGRLVRTA